MCRSRESHHSEDGDPRLHAPTHSGDARELGRPGERGNGQPAQRSATGQLQPQPVAQLRPKQSSHAITIVARRASSAVLLSFVSLLSGVSFRLHCDALPPVFSERNGGKGRSLLPPQTPRPLTCVPSQWSTVLTQRRGPEASRAAVGGRSRMLLRDLMVRTADDSSCPPRASPPRLSPKDFGKNEPGKQCGEVLQKETRSRRRGTVQRIRKQRRCKLTD